MAEERTKAILECIQALESLLQNDPLTDAEAHFLSKEWGKTEQAIETLIAKARQQRKKQKQDTE